MSIDNLSKHFEGKPCCKCGTTTRYVKGKRCVDCHVIKNRKWEKQNVVRHRETSRNNYQENFKKYVKKAAKWRQANPEKHRESVRKWRQLNPEKHRESQYKSLRKWQQANPEKAKECKRCGSEKVRAKRRQAEGSYTTQEWIDLKEKYDNRCLCCGRHQSELDYILQQDHIIPLSKQGTNWITNIQPLCHDCNGMGGKGTKTIDYRPHI
jgi:hypothetical protein